MKKLFLSFFLILFASTSALGEVKKQTYENGYYIGEFNSSNQRTGYGIYYFDNGDKYSGEFLNSKLHGYGIYYFKKSGNIKKANWLNVNEKYGSINWTNGDKFIGKLGNTKYGKYFYDSNNKIEFLKYINKEWKDSTYSESNTHYQQGLTNSNKAETAANKARLIVNQNKNKSEFITKKTKKTRYCKKSDGKAYKRNSVRSCFSSEKEITYAEYNKIINTKTRYCKKSDETVLKRYAVTSCKKYEEELTQTQYNIINTLIPIKELYVVVKTNYLNVHIEPLSSSKGITWLRKGDEVYVIGKVKNRNWYYIKEGFVNAQYLKKEGSFNPALIVTIGIGVFLFILYRRRKIKTDWKKYSKETISSYKSAKPKDTSYIWKKTKTSSTAKSSKTYSNVNKSTTVGGKSTKRIDPMVIKKRSKTRKKGIICKYCATENKNTANNCISCNQSLS